MMPALVPTMILAGRKSQRPTKKLLAYMIALARINCRPSFYITAHILQSALKSGSTAPVTCRGGI
jgi:hypothetical protein